MNYFCVCTLNTSIFFIIVLMFLNPGMLQSITGIFQRECLNPLPVLSLFCFYSDSDYCLSSFIYNCMKVLLFGIVISGCLSLNHLLAFLCNHFSHSHYTASCSSGYIICCFDTGGNTVDIMFKHSGMDFESGR